MDKLTNLYRIKEVADLLGVTTRTVYRRIWAGELPATKIGGLYYVKPSDLDALLGGGLPKIESKPQPELLKCGVCLRILRSADQVASRCTYENCEAVICKECYSKGHVRCRQHLATHDEKWQRASAALTAGKIQTLVRGSQARLRELNYLNRIRTRLSQIETLLHPLSGEPISIPDWEALLMQGDARAEVLRLKGAVLLDSKDTAEIPLNAWLLYRIPQNTKQVSLPLQIQVKVLSHLPKIVEDGFDSQAFTSEELTRLLIQINDSMQNEQVFRVIVLAATSGWDEQARQVILGAPSKGSPSAFNHPRLLLYLYDLESDELIYYGGDSRLVQYAELFKPLLLSEEIKEVWAAIEEQLIQSGHSSLTLDDAQKALPYSARVIRESFLEMEKSGRYRVVELSDLGIAIQQKQSI